MDYLKNLRYFKSTDTLFYIGLPMLIVGGALLLMDTLLFIFLFPYQLYVGLVLAIVGACLAFIPRSMRSGENDIDAAISKVAGDYTEDCKNKLGVADTMLKSAAVYTLGHYAYKGEPLFVRRGKSDRTPRSNLYTASVVFLLSSGLYIFEKTFSLTEDVHSEKTHEILYSSILGAKMENEKITVGEEKNIGMSYLVFTVDNGEPLRIAAKDGMETTEIINKIDKMLLKQKR